MVIHLLLKHLSQTSYHACLLLARIPTYRKVDVEIKTYRSRSNGAAEVDFTGVERGNRQQENRKFILIHLFQHLCILSFANHFCFPNKALLFSLGEKSSSLNKASFCINCGMIFGNLREIKRLF